MQNIIRLTLKAWQFFVTSPTLCHPIFVLPQDMHADRDTFRPWFIDVNVQSRRISLDAYNTPRTYDFPENGGLSPTSASPTVSTAGTTRFRRHGTQSGNACRMTSIQWRVSRIVRDMFGETRMSYQAPSDPREILSPPGVHPSVA